MCCYMLRAGFFTFPDKDKFRVFGILPPDRVLGDL